MTTTPDNPGHPDNFELRLSPDRREFAIWEPGNEPWFIPAAAMQGRFVDSPEMDRLGWTRYLPAAQPPVSRDAALREAADALDASKTLRDLTDDHMHDVHAAANELRRMADEEQPAETHVVGDASATPECIDDCPGCAQEQPAATPCSDPPCNYDGEGYPCDTHATEQAHADGDHQYCGITCEAEFTSEKLRNGILWRAAPGSPAMLDELLRRAALCPSERPAAPPASPNPTSTPEDATRAAGGLG